MNNVISGHSFANISDYIFAKEVKDNNFRKHVLLPLRVDLLSNNEIIYCKTDYINKLFKILNNVSDVSVNIITHESDYEINENLFSLKPSCVKNWYAINVNYEHKNLIPIPLGIANDYCNITLKFNSIKKTTIKKEKLLYVNHRINTNPDARLWLYDYFHNNNWCTVDQPNLDLKTFEETVNRHKFMLCPRGNGIDTHRLWECLYLGVIPVVEKHITNKNIRDMPILFVDSFKQINEEFLIKNENNIGYNIEKLDINWWKKYILEN